MMKAQTVLAFTSGSLVSCLLNSIPLLIPGAFSILLRCEQGRYLQISPSLAALNNQKITSDLYQGIFQTRHYGRFYELRKMDEMTRFEPKGGFQPLSANS